MVSVRVILLLAVLVTNLWPASVEWSLGPRVSVQEQSSARLTVKTSVEVSRIEFPQVAAITWLSHDRIEQSRTSRFVNGQQTVSNEFTYLVVFTITEAGDFIIPPVTVHLVDGSTVSSLPAAIKAAPPRAIAQGNFLAQVTFSPQTVVIGEEVTMTYELYIKRNANYSIRSFGAKPPAEAIVLNEEEATQSEETDDNKVSWNVVKKQWSLIFTQAGTFQGSGQQQIAKQTGRDVFGSPRLEQLAPIPIKQASITVKNLPTQGQPSGFEGLIGPISIELQLDRDTVVVGQGGMLSLLVQGRNVDLMSRPQLPEIEGLRFYDIDESKDQNEALFRWSVEPTEPGRHMIPPIRVPYYDPQQKKYHHATHSPLEFQAAPGRKLTAQASGHTEVSSEARSSDAIIGTDAPQALRGQASWYGQWGWQVTAGLLALLIGLVTGLSQRASTNAQNRSGPHRGQALARALRTDDLAQINQALHTVQAAIDNAQDQERCRALLAAVEQARFGGSQLSSEQRREAHRLTRYV